MSTTLRGAHVVGRGDADIEIVDDKIAQITSRIEGSNEIDCTGLTLLPGFIDVHNHGAVGFDVNAAGVDEMMAIARFLASEGVTAWMPTLVPDSDENYARVIEAIDRLIEAQSGEAIAQAVGVHYEGVFANEKMCGALRPQFFKTFSGNELSELPRLKRGAHMTTFAPEVDGGVELARELTKQGWIASIGHTRADVKTLEAACEAGARHMTHFFNAMTGIHHRDVGVAGWGLTNDDVTFDIIADGIHVDSKMLALAIRAKGASGVSLISDSVAPTGLGDGSFKIWGEDVTVVQGRTQNERGSIAGSVITMADAVKRTRSLGFDWPDIAMMASLNPAKLLGIDESCGSIDIGKRSDLVGLDDLGNIKLVLVGGVIAFDAR
jgi:N-acetylglucosamine-6-phosphate deacetylase